MNEYPRLSEERHEELREMIFDRDRRIAELEAALKYVKDTITHDASGYDAADCINNVMAGKACALDALLAQARREALEAAADKAKDNERHYFTALMTEDELRRMAREVQLDNVRCAPGSGQEVEP